MWAPYLRSSLKTDSRGAPEWHLKQAAFASAFNEPTVPSLSKISKPHPPVSGNLELCFTMTARRLRAASDPTPPFSVISSRSSIRTAPSENRPVPWAFRAALA